MSARPWTARATPWMDRVTRKTDRATPIGEEDVVNFEKNASPLTKYCGESNPLNRALSARRSPKGKKRSHMNTTIHQTHPS